MRRHRRTFQSTLPAWGSDPGWFRQHFPCRSFNPRSPRGGATCTSVQAVGLIVVSIHAPRVGERHGYSLPAQEYSSEFQSTLPAWGSDYTHADNPRDGAVSIHAPRVGERRRHCLIDARGDGFNPRSPRGGATRRRRHTRRERGFQSTLPAWGSDTFRFSILCGLGGFQSTLPAWGSDRNIWRCKWPLPHIWAPASLSYRKICRLG